NSTPAPSRVNLYPHLGSVEVPNKFTGFVTSNWIDAWAGYLESPDQTLRVEWRAGMIGSVLERRKRDIVWTREEEINTLPAKMILLRNKSGDTLVARVGWLEFAALVKKKEDEQIFTAIVRSYQKERCTTCRSLSQKIAD